MAEYSAGFATAYDRFWAPYPRRMAEAWLRFHAEVAPDHERSLLDVGCGTGILAAQFAGAGYQVTAVDVSAPMLEVARERLAGTGAVLLQADAAAFEVPRPAALALSTYDIPNHLGGLDQVRGYLACVHRAVRPGGWFGFDLCTAAGLGAEVAPVTRSDEVAVVAVNRGPLAGAQRSLHIDGAVRGDDGELAGFTATITNTCYPVAQVLGALAEVGWVDTYVAAVTDLRTPVPDPEALDRVAVISRRGRG